MGFSHPEILWALLAVPLLVAWFGFGIRRARAELALFAGVMLQESLAPGYSWRKNLLKGTLRTIAFAVLVVALAGPQFGSQLVKVERTGIDIVIALDTSLSMMAEDMLPNRLERAKHEITDLIKGLDGDRVGLVVFAGDAFAMCPLTVDYDAALMFARSVDVYMVSEPGTAIDKAIDASVALFDDKLERDQAIILVTDGENHEGNPIEAAITAKEKGIRVFTIGIGNPTGELIPERGNDGTVEQYKKDKRGETVLTQLDEMTLQQVAAATDGKYLPATREGLELKILYSEIAGMDRGLIRGEFSERKKERYSMFLAIALALLILDSLVSSRATGLRKKRVRWLHTGVSTLFLVVLMSSGVSAARQVDRSLVRTGNEHYSVAEYAEALQAYRAALGDTLNLPRDYHGAMYNQGNALYMQDKFKEAVDRYQRSFSEDSTLTGNMLYNRANALLKAGELQGAIESYVQSLSYVPDDEDARHNLEFALRILEQQQQQQDQQQESGDQQDQQDQEQDQQQQDQQEQQEQEQQNQENQEQQEPQEQDEEQNQQQADSTQTPPPQADSTAVPPPQLSPEDLMSLSKEDALRILQVLEEQERKLQKERRKAAFRRLKRSGKDW